MSGPSPSSGVIDVPWYVYVLLVVAVLVSGMQLVRTVWYSAQWKTLRNAVLYITFEDAVKYLIIVLVFDFVQTPPATTVALLVVWSWHGLLQYSMIILWFARIYLDHRHADSWVARNLYSIFAGLMGMLLLGMIVAAAVMGPAFGTAHFQTVWVTGVLVISLLIMFIGTYYVARVFVIPELELDRETYHVVRKSRLVAAVTGAMLMAVIVFGILWLAGVSRPVISELIGTSAYTQLLRIAFFDTVPVLAVAFAFGEKKRTKGDLFMSVQHDTNYESLDSR